MARYEQTYTGERRTAALHVQLTPAERAALEAAASVAGAASLSAYVRMLCLRRIDRRRGVANRRRHPEIRRLINELIAVGNNLNQLARIANTCRALPALAELSLVLDLVKAAIERVVDL